MVPPSWRPAAPPRRLGFAPAQVLADAAQRGLEPTPATSTSRTRPPPSPAHSAERHAEPLVRRRLERLHSPARSSLPKVPRGERSERPRRRCPSHPRSAQRASRLEMSTTSGRPWRDQSASVPPNASRSRFARSAVARLRREPRCCIPCDGAAATVRLLRVPSRKPNPDRDTHISPTLAAPPRQQGVP